MTEESLMAEAAEQLRLGRRVAEAALAIHGDTETRLSALAIACRALNSSRKAFREIGYAIFAAGGDEEGERGAGVFLH